MKRTWSRLAIAAPLALLLGTAMLPAMVATPASAGWDEIGTGHNKQGDTVTYYQNDKTIVVCWEHDGVLHIVFIDTGKSDPDPNSTSSGKGTRTDKPDVAALIKQGVITINVHVAPADSAELSKLISTNGSGLGPHGNPGDQDTVSGPGRTPVHSDTVDKTTKEIAQATRVMNQVARDLEGIATAMGDADSGEGPTTANKNNNGNNGHGVSKVGDYTEGQNKTLGKTESLGAFPQLVNPPPKSKARDGKISTSMLGTMSGIAGKSIGNAGTYSRAARKSGVIGAGAFRVGTAAGSTANSGKSGVIGAGLLEGGTSFSFGGPAGTGSALGAGGGRGAAAAPR
jgi:hypothetical protein